MKQITLRLEYEGIVADKVISLDDMTIKGNITVDGKEMQDNEVLTATQLGMILRFIASGKAFEKRFAEDFLEIHKKRKEELN